MRGMGSAVLALGLLGGCSSDQQYLDDGQSEAITTALDRGRFELECPAATGTVLSQELVQPPVVGWGMIPVARSEYTVGVWKAAVSAAPTPSSAAREVAAALRRVSRERRGAGGSGEEEVRRGQVGDAVDRDAIRPG